MVEMEVLAKCCNCELMDELTEISQNTQADKIELFACRTLTNC